jgi:signal transduction histidine kinase
MTLQPDRALSARDAGERTPWPASGLALRAGLHLVAPGPEAGRWRAALAEAGVDARVSESADVAGLRPALRDPLDLILVWDDAAGERALAARAAVVREGMEVPVAAVLFPGAPAAAPALLAAGVAAVLAPGLPELLPGTLERALREARLVAREALIGRIAHDLNNLLAPIPLAVQLLQRAPGGPGAAGQLGAVDLATRGSMAAVRGLSELLATPAEAPLRIPAKHLLALPARHWRKVLGGRSGDPPGVLSDYPSDLGSVRGDAVRLLQVLTCLARRALDQAVGGDLLFRGRRADGETGEPGPSIELRVVCGASGFQAAPEPEAPTGPDSAAAGAPADDLAALRELVEAHGGRLRTLSIGPEAAGYALLLPAAAASTR